VLIAGIVGWMQHVVVVAVPVVLILRVLGHVVDVGVVVDGADVVHDHYVGLGIAVVVIGRVLLL